MKLATSIALIAAFAAVTSASTLVKPIRNNIQTNGNVRETRFIPAKDAWLLVGQLSACVAANGPAHHVGPLVELLARPEITEEFKYGWFEKLWPQYSTQISMCVLMPNSCDWKAMEQIAFEVMPNLLNDEQIQPPISEDAKAAYIENVLGCFDTVKPCLTGRQGQHVAKSTDESFWDFIPSDFHYAIYCVLEDEQGGAAVSYFESLYDVCGQEHWDGVYKYVDEELRPIIEECLRNEEYMKLMFEVYPKIKQAAFNHPAIDQKEAESHANNFIAAGIRCL